MKEFYLVDWVWKNDNTPEYGYGDYPEKKYYLSAKVNADTLRKAQNLIKKNISGTVFGGVCSPILLESDEFFGSTWEKLEKGKNYIELSA